MFSKRNEFTDAPFSDVFGGYEVGGEMAYSSKGLVAEKPLAIALNYMQYMVYNTTTPVDYTYSNYADALKADAEDPGQQDAMSPDLRAFVARGGKLLHYYGHADQLISPGNSVGLVVARPASEH
jgi:hypothetical protein